MEAQVAEAGMPGCRVNVMGEPMMTNLNMTSHLQTPDVRY